jgi:hypothetical protein
MQPHDIDVEQVCLSCNAACHVRRVIGHKVSNQLPSAVMIMALAGPRSASLNDAVDVASKAGITVFTSAGERMSASVTMWEPPVEYSAPCQDPMRQAWQCSQVCGQAQMNPGSSLERAGVRQRWRH